MFLNLSVFVLLNQFWMKVVQLLVSVVTVHVDVNRTIF